MILALNYNNYYSTGSAKTHCLVYWPEEESVSIVKCSDVIQPFSDIPESEVTVKIGRQAVRGILKFSGTIKEVRIHEKQVCESLAEEREPFEDTTNLHPESNETAVARRPPNKKKRNNVENDHLTTQNSKQKKRRKEKETTGRILLIAPHDDNAYEETPENIDERTMDGDHSSVHQDVECGSVHSEDFGSVQADVTNPSNSNNMSLCNSSNISVCNSSNMSLCNSSSEWDIIHVQVMVNNLQSEVATLKATQAELLEVNKSFLSRIRELEMIVQAGQEVAAYARNTTPIYTHSLAPNMHTSGSHEASLVNTPTHTSQPSQTLASIDSVVIKYSNLHTPSNISRLAVKLAKEAVFGQAILAQSTPLGFRDLQPLDPAGLETIKATVKNLCVWSNPVDFEKTWKNCMHAIGQACKHARKN